jgi:hypothetical protein
MDNEVDNEVDTPFNQRIEPVRSQTSYLIANDVRELVARYLKDDVRSTLRGRSIWRRISNTFEAVAKGLTAVSSVLAFAASATENTKTADILSFTSGTVGTIGLVLLTYSTYAIKESQQRTHELNSVLTSIGVTPVTELDDGGAPDV